MSIPHTEVPLLVPDMPDRHALWPYLERIDEARQYSNFGPLTRELEEKLAERFSARAGRQVHVATTSSATLGLELSLASLGLPPRSRVLVPSLTFVATATAVARAGHIPVAADVDEYSWALTPAIAKAAFEAQPFAAAMPVATFGQGQSFDAWREAEIGHGGKRIPIVVDAAAAFGSQWVEAERTTGAACTAVFSLHTTKSMPAGEGGLVVSTDASFVADVRQRTNFGINLNAARGGPIGAVDRIGTNAKLSEYHAAVGLASLARWPDRAALRYALQKRYRALLDEASGGQLRWQAGNQPAAPTLLCARWPGAGMAHRLERICAERGVMTRRWYQPLLGRHPLPPGLLERLPTPVADRIAPELIGLPFFPGMTTAQIALVAECVAQACKNRNPPARALTQDLSARVAPAPISTHPEPYGHH